MWVLRIDAVVIKYLDNCYLVAFMGTKNCGYANNCEICLCHLVSNVGTMIFAVLIKILNQKLQACW
jgi:hypothetical protein